MHVRHIVSTYISEHEQRRSESVTANNGGRIKRERVAEEADHLTCAMCFVYVCIYICLHVLRVHYCICTHNTHVHTQIFCLLACVLLWLYVSLCLWHFLRTLCGAAADCFCLCECVPRVACRVSSLKTRRGQRQGKEANVPVTICAPSSRRSKNMCSRGSSTSSIYVVSSLAVFLCCPCFWL